MNAYPAHPFKTLHEIAKINPPRPAVHHPTGDALYVSVNAVQANGDIAASASSANRNASETVDALFAQWVTRCGL